MFNIKPLKSEELFVTCAGNLEPYLLEELKSLGIVNVRRSFRGVYAPLSIENVYRINYCSRLATRVLWPLLKFPCPNREILYRATREIDWRQYLNLSKTFSIDANLDRHPALRNSHFAALVVKDAICDQLREHLNGRPSVDLSHPDLQLNLFIHRQVATLSLDTSGAPLYKRGWRQETLEAPLQESLAAAVLKIARYEPASDILCDPFCGSGTLLIEAAMIATHTPPGFFRKKWGFSSLPLFSLPAWQSFKSSIDQKRIQLFPGKIIGADRDPSAVQLARRHLELTGFASQIEVYSRSIDRFHPPIAPTLLISNPPYGHRLQSSTAIYQDLSHFLSLHHIQRAYILAPEDQLSKVSGLSSRSILHCLNGGIEVGLFSLKTG